MVALGGEGKHVYIYREKQRERISKRGVKRRATWVRSVCVAREMT